MSKGPIKLDSLSQRPGNRGQSNTPGTESTRPAGIESLLGEVAHYYEEQLTMLNKELASARASAAQYQFQPQTTQSREISQLQTALDSADHDRNSLRTQLDQAEEKIDSLANLYLAAYTLHRRHEWSQIMRGLTDVLVNQIGADSFAVFVRDNDGRLDVILSQLPPDGAPTGDELAASLLRTEIDYDLEGLVADVPLIISDQVVGCIHIYRLLSQKRSLNDADKKLLMALSSLAATAIVASSTSRPKTTEPKNIELGADRDTQEPIKSRLDSIVTKRSVVPEATDVFNPNVQIAGDLSTDLSEMPPALLDYSTLLHTPPEEFGQADSDIPVSQQAQPQAKDEPTVADRDSSRFRALSANSSSSKAYQPGADYLKFVGMGAAAQPEDSSTSGTPDDISQKAKESDHREPGLLFRKSPIKRA